MRTVRITPIFSADVARQIIKQTRGRIFGCKAYLRSDRPRTFNAKLYEDSFDEVDLRNDQVKVIDIAKTRQLRQQTGKPDVVAYRTIPLEGVLEVHADGKEIKLAEVQPLTRQ